MSEQLLGLIAEQSKALQLLMKKLNEKEENQLQDNSPQKTMDLLGNSISEYCHDPQSKTTFGTWYARYEDAFTVDGAKLDDAAKVRLLLRKLDPNTHSAYINFILPKKPGENDFDQTVKILKKMFGEPESLFSIRYNCLKLMKKSTEDYIAFASVVNKECERFKFAELTPDQFKCLIFICGLQTLDKDIRARLLAKLEADNDINLDKLTTECKRLMDLKSDADLIYKNPSASVVPQVRKVGGKSKKYRGKEFTKSSDALSSQAHNQSQKPKVPYRPCWLCGGKHFVRDCSYVKHVCKDCNKMGHKEGFCNSAQPRQQHFTKNNVIPKQTKGIFAVSRVNFAAKRKYINVSINNCLIRLQVDTASDVTIISRSNYEKLGTPSAIKCTERAMNASGEPLPLTLEFECTIAFNDIDTTGICYVTDIPDLNVVGNDWLDLFGLYDVPLNTVCNRITATPDTSDQAKFMDEFKRKFSSVFDNSLGTCNKTTVTLRLKPDVKPIFCPRRPVSYAATPIIDAELDRLLELGVITPVSYSEWAAPIVNTKKPNGSIRMCADFATGLNDALETYHYPLPTSDSVFATLNGGKFFSKIDFSDAFFQIVVDESSRQYLTINTHRGLFRFNRLPFGIKIASAVFQQIIDAMIAGLKRTCGFMDDITVNGATIEEHNRNLIALFERIEQWGFRIRIDKCKFLMKQIEFLGFVIDENGRRPNQSKVDAIANMPEPYDVATVKSFLGMINYYYSQFVKEMRALRAPLDKLLCKDVKFEWTEECRDAFNKAKQILLSDLLLTHYDPNMEVKVAADASIYGLGAVILHRYPDGSEKAIEHASRSLTPAEKNYGQIEKEALSLVFAVKKFHKMIWGRKFILETDHKPLLAIFGSKKGIPIHSSSRLQRWAIALMSYDFVVEHKNSENFGHADVLSRLIANHQSQLETIVISSIRVFERSVYRILVDAIRILPVTAEMIAKDTSDDQLLSSVRKYLKTSWPKRIDDDLLRIFYNRRDSLCEIAGCLLFNDRVVIPLSLQMSVLQQLHIAHPGIVRMKSLARSYVYWPNIDIDITDYVNNCSRCATTAKAPVKATLSSWPKAPTVWSRVHIDFAGEFMGLHFFVVVDSFSKWPEIFVMSSTTANATISKLKELISRFGNMDILVSDNGPPFQSAEFEKFCKEEGIYHIRVPPHFPQSNGQAERFVDTFKRALSKAKGEETVPNVLQTFLQRYRITPNAQLPNDCSPAEVMFGRKIKTSLDLVKPKVKFDIIRDDAMEEQFNVKHGGKHRIYHPNQSVYVRDFRNRKVVWTPDTIIERIGTVVYNVECEGFVWRRHANQIRIRYVLEDEESDPTLSLLYDAFETPHNVIQQPEELATAPPHEEIQREIVSSTLSNIETRPQRNRRPPVRTDFSTSVKGRYLDLNG